MKAVADTGRLAQVLPAFSIAAAVTYFLVMGFGVVTFIYYPQVGEWRLSRQDGLGPPMYFYGWLLDALLAGSVAAGAAAILPRRMSGQVMRAYSWASWITPVALTLCVMFFLRTYFGL